MNKFLTFQGQQPLYLGDIDFASEAVRNAFAQLIAGLLGSDSANAIVSGVVLAARSSTVSWTDGVVFIDGEILPVEAGLASGALTDTWYLRIKSTYGGTREFVGGETHDCWETRTVELTRDVTDYPLSSFRRIEGGFGSQLWSSVNGGYELRLVKTGLVWLVTVKRPPMTQSEDSFFEVNISGIPAEDISKFPSYQDMVPTTAYIDDGQGGLTAEMLYVRYNKTDGGALHIEMELASGLGAAGYGYAQVVLPVF